MNIKIEQDSIIIKTKYDPAIIEKIKAVPDGRRWDKDARAWVIAKTADNIASLENSGINIPGNDNLLNEIQKQLKFDSDILNQLINPKETSFYKHQNKGIAILWENYFAALFWEQGVGKTLPVIIIIQNMAYSEDYPKVKPLIVCPKNVIGSWMRQFEEFSNIIPVQIVGNAKKRKEILRENHDCYIINYDLLPGMLEDLQAANFEMIVFDESQYIKSITSQRSKAAYELAKGISRRYLLTGTPIGNGSIDIFQQFKVLDPSIFGTSFYAFRNKYFIDRGWSFKDKKTGKERKVPDWKIKPNAIDEMRRKIALRAHRLTKAECLDLPEKIYQTIEVEMTPEQKIAYQQALKEIKIFINGEEYNTRQAIVKMMRLNQICSGHIGSGENTEEIYHRKLIELYRLWDDAGKPKMVVWTPFTYDIETITHEFREANALNIYGGNTQEINDLSINLFQEDEKFRIIVCNERSGGVGITLTASSFVVYYSRSYSLLNRLQSEDRTHRIGQKRAVNYINLVCAGTIELDILAALEEKRKVSRELLGDDIERNFVREIIRGLK